MIVSEWRVRVSEEFGVYVRYSAVRRIDTLQECLKQVVSQRSFPVVNVNYSATKKPIHAYQSLEQGPKEPEPLLEPVFLNSRYRESEPIK